MKSPHFINYLLSGLCCILLLLPQTIHAQAAITEEEAEWMDSVILATPEVALCVVNGYEDKRFLNRTPEKHSDYRTRFQQAADSLIHFDVKSRFFCDIEVDITCNGRAGNYIFRIEPAGFSTVDFNNFKEMMEVVNYLSHQTLTPAIHLGEKVNSRIKFRLMAVNGRPALR